jgi:hypothetical protein
VVDSVSVSTNRDLARYRFGHDGDEDNAVIVRI